MPTFVPVQVPDHLVLDVYRFIADHELELPSAEASPKNLEARDWSLEQLTQLHESNAKAVRLMAQVLTVLVKVAPVPVSIDELGEQLGLDGMSIRKSFGGASKWMKSRFGGDTNWPIHWRGETHWYLNEHNASLWRQVIG